MKKCVNFKSYTTILPHFFNFWICHILTITPQPLATSKLRVTLLMGFAGLIRSFPWGYLTTTFFLGGGGKSWVFSSILDDTIWVLCQESTWPRFTFSGPNLTLFSGPSLTHSIDQATPLLKHKEIHIRREYWKISRSRIFGSSPTPPPRFPVNKLDRQHTQEEWGRETSCWWEEVVRGAVSYCNCKKHLVFYKSFNILCIYVHIEIKMI